MAQLALSKREEAVTVGCPIRYCMRNSLGISLLRRQENGAHSHCYHHTAFASSCHIFFSPLQEIASNAACANKRAGHDTPTHRKTHAYPQKITCPPATDSMTRQHAKTRAYVNARRGPLREAGYVTVTCVYVGQSLVVAASRIHPLRHCSTVIRVPEHHTPSEAATEADRCRHE